MHKFINLTLTLWLAIGGVFISRADAQASRYENFDSAVNLLASYYDAVNRREYRRAYGYWESPTGSYDEFVRGYAETASVQLIVQPPTSVGAAAGSLYAQILTVLIATNRDGRRQTFSGCYTMRKSNLRPPAIPQEAVWQIYRATMTPAPADAMIPTLLAGSGSENSSQNPNTREEARVLGIIDFGDERSPLAALVSTAATIARSSSSVHAIVESV